MASTRDLTTLAALKAWLNIPNTNSDAILSALITAASRVACGWMNRDEITPRTVTLHLDGFGGNHCRMTLPLFPVLSVTSLIIDQTVIPATALPTVANPAAPNGYYLDVWDGVPPGINQVIDLFGGYCFNRGRNNVQVACTSGYQITGEAATIPGTPFVVTPQNTYGRAATDAGVTFATGAALVPVTGTPATGQYSVTTGLGNVAYTFAAADAGKAVLISYGYVPQDIEQAVMEIAAERFRYRDRIGMGSKTLAGQETVTFTAKELTDPVKLMLQPYRSVIAS